MSDLVVIAYETEAKAEEMRQRLFKLQSEYLINIEDAVIAVRTEDGKIQLRQMVNTTAAGAASGSFWGLVIGMIFFVPFVGAVAGAAAGALSGALTDYGLDDTFAKKVSDTLEPGHAALFVLFRKITADKVLKDIEGTGGTVMRTSLDHTKEEALRRALAEHAGTESDVA